MKNRIKIETSIIAFTVALMSVFILVKPSGYISSASSDRCDCGLNASRLYTEERYLNQEIYLR